MLGRRALSIFIVAAAYVVAFAVSGLQAAALPVSVALDWPAGAPTSGPAGIHVQAIRIVGETGSTAPVEAEAALNGVILDLGEGVWQVQASASGYWSQEVQVAAGNPGSAGVRLSMWPAATLRGEIAAAGGEPLPQALAVHLSAATTVEDVNTARSPGAQTAPSPAHAELRCPINGTTWSCPGPAGLFDVRLEASGYAPRYVWGVSLKTAANIDLGRTALQRAASVFGRVVRADGSDPPGPCEAILQAEVERRGPRADPDSPPADESLFPVQLSRSGYFQVVGVIPGRHSLDVECPAASGFRELMVAADGETHIDPPLKLEELVLDIGLTPAADPSGEPWQLTVEATEPRLRRIATRASASADGRWTRHGLMAGNYHVVVGSVDGTQWLARNVDLNPRSTPLTLRLAAEKVAGSVEFSSEPVRARLIFSNDTAGASATLTSGDDGRFQGVLPVPPGAAETQWTVDTHVAQPEVNRIMRNVGVAQVAGGSTAWLDLQVPTIAVRGSVLSDDGQPQRGIQVTFEDAGGVKTVTSTGDSGNYELPDLPPGKYTAAAESEDGSSDRTPFEVLQGKDGELNLSLRPSMHAVFHVVSAGGPVEDATVQVWIAPGVPRAFARTDRDGRFEVKLPRGTAEVGMTVGAGGYALKLARMPVVTDPNAPPEASNITLDRSGGSLEIDLEPSDRKLDRSTTLYLVHEGALQDARTVEGWGSSQPGTRGNGPAEVEVIEPGDYALCVVAGPSELAVLWQGTTPKNRCTTGTVKPNEMLTLTPH